MAKTEKIISGQDRIIDVLTDAVDGYCENQNYDYGLDLIFATSAGNLKEAVNECFEVVRKRLLTYEFYPFSEYVFDWIRSFKNYHEVNFELKLERGGSYEMFKEFDNTWKYKLIKNHIETFELEEKIESLKLTDDDVDELYYLDVNDSDFIDEFENIINIPLMALVVKCMYDIQKYQYYYCLLKDPETSKNEPKKSLLTYKWSAASKNLDELYDNLRSSLLIDKNTKLDEFRAVFSERSIYEVRGIRWHSDYAQEVIFLIERLMELGFIVKHRKKFEVLRSCFINSQGFSFQSNERQIKNKIKDEIEHPTKSVFLDIDNCIE